MNIKVDWQSFEKFVPNLYGYEKLVNPPYLVFTGDHELIAVIDPEENRVVHANYNVKNETIEECESQITYLLTKQTDKLLVSISNRKVIVLYNFRTKQIFCDVTWFTPDVKVTGNHALAFNFKEDPVRISKGKLDGVLLLNVAEQMLYSSQIIRENVELFFDIICQEHKINFSKRDRKDLSDLILTNGGGDDLQPNQLFSLTEIITKPKDIVPVKNMVSEFLFSEFVGGNRPKNLSDVITLTIDLDLSAYKISEVKFLADSGDFLFYIRTNDVNAYDETSLAELLGGSNYRVIYIVN